MIALIVVLVIIAIFLFLVFPSVGRKEIKRPFKGLLVAHRGLFTPKVQTVPENSLAAFKAAIEKGYGIETDLRFTKDKEIVLFHDNDLKRMCGCETKVSALTLEELEAFTLAESGERIPTFKEFLKLVDGKVPLILEYKADYGEEAELCAAANQLLKEYKGLYCVESFNPKAMAWYKKHRKDICRGQLAMPPKKRGIIDILAGSFMLNFYSRPDFAAFDMRSPKNFFFKLQRCLGAMPVGWTITSKEQLAEMEGLCDSNIFEGFNP